MSKKFVILADATCDLNAEIRKTYDIEILYGHIRYPSGEEQVATLDWKDFSILKEYTPEEFYNELKKNPNSFSTSPPNVQEHYNAFEKCVKDGYDVLSLSLSSGLSGTFNFASKAKDMIIEKYPDAKILCVDSLRFSTGCGLMAMYASTMRSEGKTIEEVYNYLEENKNCFHQMGWLDDLSYVAKKGRISHPKAFFGKLIGIKPIGEFDFNGLTTVIGKAKGEKSAYKAMIEYIRQTIINPEEQIIFVAHTNRRAQAEEYKALIEETFHPKAVYINDVFPLSGINIGPGLMAAYYRGKPISEGLVQEKEILSKILLG